MPPDAVLGLVEWDNSYAQGGDVCAGRSGTPIAIEHAVAWGDPKLERLRLLIYRFL